MDFGNALSHNVNKAIHEHLPMIQNVFREKVGATALEAAKNDETCEAIFTNVHKQLPMAVRLVIRKDAFVKYCFENRDKLIQE
jgi:hypothetical protein